MGRDLPFAWFRFAEEQLSADPAWPVAALAIGFEKASSRDFQWTSRAHDRFHPRWHLIQLTLKGHGLYRKAPGVPPVTLVPGKVFHLSKGDEGAYGCDGDAPWEFLWFKCTGAWTDEVLSRMAARWNVWDAGVDSPLASALERIVRGAHRGRMGGTELASASFEVVAELRELARPERRTEEVWIRRLRQRVDLDLAGIDVKTLAAEAGLSLGRFETRFKKAAGLSPHAFLVEARVRKAAHLLGTTGKKVTEIARLVGFDDPGYFTKVFRKARGVTPQRFREWRG